MIKVFSVMLTLFACANTYAAICTWTGAGEATTHPLRHRPRFSSHRPPWCPIWFITMVSSESEESRRTAVQPIPGSGALDGAQGLVAWALTDKWPAAT
ncbi:MAG TPA: hypothetical protein VFE67_19355 [Rudaea sp.]|jgi:hypothetical protein|nr:hypothetical protein [Rudaea sp.]